ncbi:MAG: protein-glutamate O-methyltransferase CheR [Desulfobacteraceae bacterium]|nr:protein-glutamate O-methyltransferase CheR [Desulfobacteraceae bacterium]
MSTLSKKLSDKQFRQFSSLVYNECGICLTHEKQELLKSRLAKRLRLLNISHKQYYTMVLNDKIERSRFIDAISTNHTYFFRESRSFYYISPDCKHIWCAASSSGEEPYSVAAYCLNNGVKPLIWATDISETCLEKATRAIYPEQSQNSIPDDLLKKYFQKGIGRWNGYIRAKSCLRRMIRFKKFNLLKDVAPNRIFDIIFCRNVMIYFDTPTKEAVIQKLENVLGSKGYLIIGGAESLNGLKHSLKYIEPSVYKKIARPDDSRSC